jgi:hypothetical protein
MPLPFSLAATTGVCSPVKERSRLMVTARLSPRISQGERTSTS